MRVAIIVQLALLTGLIVAEIECMMIIVAIRTGCATVLIVIRMPYVNGSIQKDVDFPTHIWKHVPKQVGMMGDVIGDD